MSNLFYIDDFEFTEEFQLIGWQGSSSASEIGSLSPIRVMLNCTDFPDRLDPTYNLKEVLYGTTVKENEISDPNQFDREAYLARQARGTFPLSLFLILCVIGLILLITVAWVGVCFWKKKAFKTKFGNRVAPRLEIARDPNSEERSPKTWYDVEAI